MIQRFTCGFILLLGLSGLSGCGGNADDGARHDFVGQAAKGAGAMGGQSKKSQSPNMVTVIDLTEDLAFRYRLDGWTLDHPQAQVTARGWRSADVGMVLASVGNKVGNERPDYLKDIKITTELLAKGEGEVVPLVEGVKRDKAGKTAVVLLIEGADQLAGLDLDGITKLKSKGVGAVGLVNGHSNWIGGAAVSGNEGLTKRGATFVQMLRDSQIAIDLTHASSNLFYDVLVEQGLLAMVSHSAAAGIRFHPRNLNDLQIITLHRLGGLMGVVFNPDFIRNGEGPCTLADVVAHFSRIRRLGAADILAIGSDWNGIHPPVGLESVDQLPALVTGLLGAGFSKAEVAGVMGDNARRFFDNVLAQNGTFEVGRNAPERPLACACDLFSGEAVNGIARACDQLVLGPGVNMSAGARLRLRLLSTEHTTQALELFGVAGTPWQVEAQNLDGKIVVKRALRLDDSGHGRVPLPENKGVVRLFVNPTRDTELYEAVVWGR